MQIRYARCVCRAGSEHQGAAADFTALCHDLVSTLDGPYVNDGGMSSYGCRTLSREPGDEAHNLRQSHKAVRIGTRVSIARQPTQTVGREQPQRVPPLLAPGIRHFSALEHDVVDRALGENAAHRESGVPGPDDDCGEAFYVAATLVGPAVRRPRRSRWSDW